MNKEEQNKFVKSCHNCGFFGPIGQGDAICYGEDGKYGVCRVVMLDYEPTDEYLDCGGKEWEPR